MIGFVALTGADRSPSLAARQADRVHSLPLAHVETAVVAAGLPGSMLSWPSRPLEDVLWRELLWRVDRSTLSGLLVQAIVSETLPTTDEQAWLAHRLHARVTSAVLWREAALLEAAEAFDRAGLTSRALGGVATAHLVYADPGTRPYRTVRVLVPRTQFDDALQALAALGYTRGSPPLRPGFDATFGAAVRLARADGMSIDLHRTLVRGPFGQTIELGALFRGATVFPVGSRSLEALPPEAHFLYSCYRAAVDRSAPRPLWLRDVAQQVLGDGLDSQRVLELARAWAAEGVVALAVRWSWERLALSDAVPLSVWAARYAQTRRERWFLAGYRSRRYAHNALDTLRMIRGLRAKAAFLRAVALPDEAWLAYHGQRRLHWLRRGLSSVSRPRMRP